MAFSLMLANAAELLWHRWHDGQFLPLCIGMLPSDFDGPTARGFGRSHNADCMKRCGVKVFGDDQVPANRRSFGISVFRRTDV